MIKCVDTDALYRIWQVYLFESDTLRKRMVSNHLKIWTECHLFQVNTIAKGTSSGMSIRIRGIGIVAKARSSIANSHKSAPEFNADQRRTP